MAQDRGLSEEFSADDLLPLSALQHLAFCARQCALIHLECVWDDNRLTVEGRQLHEQVHEQGNESRGDLRIARGVALSSLRLGLSGIADVVEFHHLSDAQAADAPAGARLPGTAGLWRPFPVEYKRGRPKKDDCDKVQLCAQALCLEEMLGAAVPTGALFYGRTRRRLDVAFTNELRRETEETAGRLHRLFASRTTPKPKLEKKCRNCSLQHLCVPKSASRCSAERYIRETIEQETRVGNSEEVP